MPVNANASYSAISFSKVVITTLNNPLVRKSCQCMQMPATLPYLFSRVVITTLNNPLVRKPCPILAKHKNKRANFGDANPFKRFNNILKYKQFTC